MEIERGIKIKVITLMGKNSSWKVKGIPKSEVD